jgi:hypothetical protein
MHVPVLLLYLPSCRQSSNAPLDMAYGRDTVYVDIVSNKGPHQVDKPSRSVQERSLPGWLAIDAVPRLPDIPLGSWQG